MADPDAATPAGPDRRPGDQPGAEPDLAVVVGTFGARPEARAELAGVLARYVVLTRRAPACRNVDLLINAADGASLLVIEKWDSPEAARAHLDAAETVEMAQAAVPLLATRPTLELFDSISAHDLR